QSGFPAPVTEPATSRLSFTANVKPANGPTAAPGNLPEVQDKTRLTSHSVYHPLTSDSLRDSGSSGLPANARPATCRGQTAPYLFTQNRCVAAVGWNGELGGYSL